jgi:hypothetical protein
MNLSLVLPEACANSGNYLCAYHYQPAQAGAVFTGADCYLFPGLPPSLRMGALARVSFRMVHFA